jgi:TolB-like protein/Tfp pilus assembly protein PilF
MPSLADSPQFSWRLGGICYCVAMLFRFDPFELDGQTFELRQRGVRVAVEPQVLSLLLLLVSHRDRLVSKDEIVRLIWNGRSISDAAVASRIKSARQALGDDGRQQRMIQTIHGRGFRFVHPVEEGAADRQPATAIDSTTLQQPEPGDRSGRPSIAVLPFQLLGASSPYALMAEALPHDLLAEFARLRWLFVVARGSSFRLAAAQPDIGRIGTLLAVRYCLTGTIEVTGDRIKVSVELADTRDLGVVWSERYESRAAGVHDIRMRIVASTMAALEIRIPLHEAQAARLRDPEHLDAWSTYHLGVQHMFRFTRTDNRTAITLFTQAVAIDPNFARAHAGLSFGHFQNAFLSYTPDIATETIGARRAAERAVEIDPLDPFVNLTMGRALWLSNDISPSLGWLDRAVSLSPNYAQGLYARALSQTILCRGEAGQDDADHAMLLSPIDPLHYAMLATRALSHLVRGEYPAAAHWADRAAQAPGAHILILAIAVACHALNGDDMRGQLWADAIRRRGPMFNQAHFFRSFPFEFADIRQKISAGLAVHHFV